MLFGALNNNKEAQGLSLISKVLFSCSVLVACFVYYFLLDYRSGKDAALSGEINVNKAALTTYDDGSLLGFLFGYFGSFTYILPLFIIYAGFVLFIRRISLRQLDLFSLSLRILGFNLIVIGLTSTFSFCFSLGETGGGGILGDFLNIILKSFAPGAMGTVLSILIVLTGVSLFCAMSPLALIDRTGALITSLFSRKDKTDTAEESVHCGAKVNDISKKSESSLRISKLFETKGSIPSFKGTAGTEDTVHRDMSMRKEPVFDSNDAESDPLVSPGAILGGAGDVRPDASLQKTEKNTAESTLVTERQTQPGCNAQGPQNPLFRPSAARYDNGSLSQTGQADAGSCQAQSNEISAYKTEHRQDTYISPYNAREIQGNKRESHDLEPSTYVRDNTLAAQDNTASAQIPGDESEVHTIIYSREEMMQRRAAQQMVSREHMDSSDTVLTEGTDKTEDDEIHSIITDRTELTNSLIAQGQMREREAYQREHEKSVEEPSTIITDRSSFMNNSTYVSTSGVYGREQVDYRDHGSCDYSEKDGSQTHSDAHYGTLTDNMPGESDDSLRSEHNCIAHGSVPSYQDVKKSFGFADENSAYTENVISFDDVNDDVSDVKSIESDMLAQQASAFEGQTSAYADSNALVKDRHNISEKDAKYDYAMASRGVFSSDSSQVMPESSLANEQSPYETEHSSCEKPLAEPGFSATSSMHYSTPDSSYAQKDEEVSGYSSENNSSSLSHGGYMQFRDDSKTEDMSSVPDCSLNEDSDNIHSSDRTIGNSSGYNEGFAENNSSSNNYPSYMQDSRVASTESACSRVVPFKSNVITAPNTVYDDWRPEIELLTPSPVQEDADIDSLNDMAKKINQVLASFGVKAQVERYITGPVITRYELSLAPGTKSSAISSLSVDLSRSLMVQTVRVIDVIPGTAYVGIEVPNKSRKLITLYDVAAKEEFKHNSYRLPLCLGCSVTGDPVVVDLVKAPHLLVAGTTGSGKSAGLNAMLVSMLLQKSPEELRLILIDPKRVEFSLYNNLPHLITPIISDVADKAAAALRWCVEEMERRYQLIETNEVRKLDEYNEKIKEAAERGEVIYDKSWSADMGGDPPVLKPLPLLVVVIEEYADLVAQTSGGRKKNENSPEQYINRLAAKARAAGIHLILATQSPRSDVLTGVIKNNIPARIAFTVQSLVDSRVILDEGGAEKLLGNGDMLCKFTSINQGVSFRCHGAFVCNSDVDAVVQSWREHGEVEYIDDVTEEPVEDCDIPDEKSSGKKDSKLEEAAAFALDYYAKNQKYPPISDFQIMLGVGYPRAKKIVIQLQNEGIIN